MAVGYKKVVVKKKKPKKVETGKRSKESIPALKIPIWKRKLKKTNGSLTLAKISLQDEETTPDQAKSKGKTEDTTVSEARESPQANMKAQRSKKSRGKKSRGKKSRGKKKPVLRLTYKKKLPPLLPIFTEPTTTLSDGVGTLLPKTRLTLQQIRELSFNREDDQITYLFFGHGDPPQLYTDGNIELLVQNDAFAKMRFGVAANDGGICFTATNPEHIFTTKEHTLGFNTTIDHLVTSFGIRYPFKFEDKLSFPNLLISEGYTKVSGVFFPSGIWRVSKGKIELFGISEVIENGFVNGIDLTQDDAKSAKQDFLSRFTDGTAKTDLYTFQQFIDKMTDDHHFQRAEVVNVLFDTCSGVETETALGQELSRAWKGRSDKYPPYKI